MFNKDTEALLQTVPKIGMIKDADGPGVGNSAIVQKIEKEDGGTCYRLFGYKFPYRGKIDNETLQKIEYVKKILLFSFRRVMENKKIILVSVILFPKRIVKKLVNMVMDIILDMTRHILYHYILNPERYSKCTKEIYRAFTEVGKREQHPAMRDKWLALRDILCMIVEFDNAYRMRLQDFFSILDVSKIIPDEADKYYLAIRGDYNFGGKTLEQRIEERKAIDGDNWKFFEPIAKRMKEYWRLYPWSYKKLMEADKEVIKHGQDIQSDIRGF